MLVLMVEQKMSPRLQKLCEAQRSEVSVWLPCTHCYG